ncbi:RNA polymerase sigma factor, partial [Enterococcus faecium]
FYEEEINMNHSLDSHITHMFDSFCKTVIRNEVRNINKQYSRIRRRQVSLSQIPKDILDGFQVRDCSIENSELYSIFGMKLIVSDLTLSEGINYLPEQKKKIILLYYFAGFNDREIGEVLQMSVGGIWYQRKEAEDELRENLEYLRNEY